MLNSFRLRLGLISALLSGVALLGFAAFTWRLVYDIKLRQIEMDVSENAVRESHRNHSFRHWQNFAETVLPRLIGVRDPHYLLFRVEEAGGQLIYQSPHWPTSLEAAKFSWPVIPDYPAEMLLLRPPPLNRPPPDQMAGPPGPPPLQHLQTLQSMGTEWRVGLAGNAFTRVAIAVDLATIEADMAAIRNGFMLAIPLALAFIGLGAWFVSGRALAPVRRLNRSMLHVTAQGLDHRIAAGGEDREFVALIAGFNAMLERLQKSFLQASRFSADAGHELKTPLTILQGQIERAMNQVEAGSAMQKTLGGILDEVRRLSAISRKLLLLSQADAGRLRLQLVRFDVSAALEELLEDTRMMSPHLALKGEVAADLTLMADAHLLYQLLANLVGNAVKYNIEAGWIHLAALRSGEQIVVTLANASAGIPALDRAKVFERFYRVESAHCSKIEGVGLGLSLALEIARAHGGTLVLLESVTDEVTFRLTLPGTSQMVGRQ